MVKLLLALTLIFATPAFAQDLSLEAYSVQVFSSQKKIESHDMALEFVFLDSPFVLPVLIKREKWYRVYVGLYPTKKEALEKLKSINKIRSDAFIVKLIN